MDRSYFARRAAEELVAAEKASSPQAAKAHRELALHYSTMIEEGAVPEKHESRLSG